MNAIGFMAESSAKARLIGAEMEVSPCLNTEASKKCMAYGINPVASGMMLDAYPSKETGMTLRRSPGGENGLVITRETSPQSEAEFKKLFNFRNAKFCARKCARCKWGQDSGDTDGGEFTWCRHPKTDTLPDFFNIFEEDMVCDLFAPESECVGFKAGQSANGGLGDEREVAPILSHKPSALEPTVAIAALFSQMRYIVRRTTPKECERLMGLPDDYTIPVGLNPNDPAIIAEFQRIFDTFGAIMAEYEHSKPPKPKTAAQVQKWLEKITNPDTCPDSPRYKACGNGLATNQQRWILTRLLAATGIDPYTGEEL